METAKSDETRVCKDGNHEWSILGAETCECGAKRVVDTGGGVYTLADPLPEIRTVRWLDSSLQNGQVDKYNFPKPEVIVTIGFLVDETDEYVTVARDDMGNGDYRGLCCIPKISVLPS